MHAHTYTHTHTHYIINNPIMKNEADVGKVMKQDIKTFILQLNCGIFSLVIGWHNSRVR